MPQAIAKFMPPTLTEGRDRFDDVDVIKLDPDRADIYDIVSALMPTLTRIAYTYLIDDKERYEKTHRDEEDDPFEFTESELEDRLDDVIRLLRDKLDDQTSSDKMSYIKALAKEFKEPLQAKGEKK